MGFYSKVIFPRFYDCLMDKPFWAQYRQAQLASAHGHILEIGVGTGLNLPHYPEHVGRIVTVDPNPGMNRRLQRRIASSRIESARWLTSSRQNHLRIGRRSTSTIRSNDWVAISSLSAGDTELPPGLTAKLRVLAAVSAKFGSNGRSPGVTPSGR